MKENCLKLLTKSQRFEDFGKRFVQSVVEIFKNSSVSELNLIFETSVELKNPEINARSIGRLQFSHWNTTLPLNSYVEVRTTSKNPRSINETVFGIHQVYYPRLHCQHCCPHMFTNASR